MAANQERNFAREAAVLLRAARSGALATVAGGWPHAALVTPALGPDGSVLLLLSDLSAHTSHLRADPRCALLVTGTAAAENPQTVPRLSLRGTACLTESDAARAAYLRHHPYAKLYAGFADFHVWALHLEEAYYVGGFAAAASLPIVALQQEIESILPNRNG
jgi:putative heme iron utilization protein